MPSDQEDLALLRPADGSEDDRIGIYTRIEPDAIRPSTYPKPVPERAGDLSGASLLRNALRLNLRADAGPFRSVGRVAFAPRPYQYVPLSMSLK